MITARIRHALEYVLGRKSADVEGRPLGIRPAQAQGMQFGSVCLLKYALPRLISGAIVMMSKSISIHWDSSPKVICSTKMNACALNAF
jgi:hypothetical protein